MHFTEKKLAGIGAYAEDEWGGRGEGDDLMFQLHLSKGKVCICQVVRPSAGTYPGFIDMKRLGVFLLSSWMGC